MFAYCGDNPITRCDTTGCFWDTVIDVVSLCCSVAEVIENPEDVNAWIGVAADAAALVIPFVAGAGILIDILNKSDDVGDAIKASSDLPVVIGETMTRVKEYAAKIGAEVFSPPDDLVGDALMAANQEWIQAMMDQGRTIYDIGLDSKRHDRSIFYAMESVFVEGYEKLIRVNIMN